MNIQKSTVIIPVRNEYDMVKLTLKYAIQNQSVEHDYIVLLDNPEEDGNDSFFEEEKKYKNITIMPVDSDNTRVGLMALVEKGIAQVKTDYFFYIHADMVPGPNWDKEMFKHMQPKSTVCGTRIEPKIFPQDKAKHQEECGLDAKDFNYKKFELACTTVSKDEVVEGFFAPHLFKTDEWIGYDMRFAPQSREETDLGMMLLEKGYKLFNSRSALFYHFAGRGSRRKDSNNVDSDEWKKSNYKNFFHFYN